MTDTTAITKSTGGGTLANVLELVLEEGIVIAGDIQIQLADVELLTIKIRLLVAGVDKAKEMGIDWWEHDQFLSSGSREDPEKLEARVKALEENGGQTREENDQSQADPER